MTKLPTPRAIIEKIARNRVKNCSPCSMSVCVCSVMPAPVSVSNDVSGRAAVMACCTRAASSSSLSVPSPSTSTASTKPGLATNSEAVAPSNRAQVALPGEAMSS